MFLAKRSADSVAVIASQVELLTQIIKSSIKMWELITAKAERKMIFFTG